MKYFKYILILLLQLIFVVSYGQQNPFDLQYRLNQGVNTSKDIQQNRVVEDIPDSVVIQQELISTGDSFASPTPLETSTVDIPEEIKAEEIDTGIKNQGEDSGDSLFNDYYITETSERGNLPPILQEKRNLIFATFLILLIMLTLVITINRSVVDHIIRAFLNDNYLNLLYREQRGKTNVQHLFLYFFFIANLGFFLFLSLDYWMDARPNVSLLLCILIVGLIYLIRYLALELLASIFPIEKEAKQFNFTIIIFNILLGLIMLPINLFLAFSSSKISLISFYLGITLLLLFYLMRQLRGLFISVRFLSSTRFQFFAYLCTVEIAPLLVGIKIYFILTA